MTKKKSADISLTSLKPLLTKVVGGMGRYAGILFFLLIAFIYSFVILRVNMLSNAQPAQSDIDAQSVSTSVPRVDPAIAEQLKQLEDNSVNVQTLFEQARNNPFQ